MKNQAVALVKLVNVAIISRANWWRDPNTVPVA
jgi:hypothetical protein